MNALERWHDYVKSRDTAQLWSLLHPDAVFESPVVHTPQKGREITFKYLIGALQVLGNDTFTYVGEWHAKNSAVLEFQTDIQGIKINGVDLITWNDEGQITHFKVMVRPLKAINLLHEMMGHQLARAQSGSAGVPPAL
jgi:hypothetical protein